MRFMRKNGAFNKNDRVKYLVRLTYGQGVDFTLNVKQTLAGFLMIPVYRTYRNAAKHIRTIGVFQ
jgi:hypothetical protein